VKLDFSDMQINNLDVKLCVRLALSKGPNRVYVSRSPRLRSEAVPVSTVLCILVT
jgi:hypothetical protein